MDLKEQIAAIVESALESKEHFIVDIHISGSPVMRKVTVVLDGDSGISVEDCAKISRVLGNTIEERDLIPTAYLLEVTSPGLDEPLKLKRQYQKNVGRKLSITLKNESVMTGKLEEVREESILIQAEKKEKKKVIATPVEVPFNDIKKSNVLVSFK
ncbi:MAG TPA: ribosome maturation factor RimP [Cytophagaceae bacterium]